MAFDHVERVRCMSGLLRLLAEEGLEPGDRLPGEQVLSLRLVATRHLVRVTIERLKSLGILERRGRSGTYLRRVPAPADWTPTAPTVVPAPPGRTISLIVMGAEVTEELRALQQLALERGFLLHIHMAHPRGLGSQDERRYLELLLESGCRGVAIHGTPVGTPNEDVFRRLAGRMRFAHVGYYGEGLPEQSFFLPDYRLAGAAGMAFLLARGRRRAAFVSGLPEGHHVNRLILAGAQTVAASSGPLSLSVFEQCVRDSQRGCDAMDELAAYGPDVGVLVYSPKVAAWLREVLSASVRDRTSWPPIILLADQSTESFPHDLPAYLLDSSTRLRDAVLYLMSDSTRLERRLYAPQFVAAEGAESLTSNTSASNR